MGHLAHLILPNGEQVNIQINTSIRHKSVRMRYSAQQGLVVSAPHSMSLKRIQALVQNEQAWVAKQWEYFHSIAANQAGLPTELNLLALHECWQIRYDSHGSTKPKLTEQPNYSLLLSGVMTEEVAKQLLKNWLMNYAKQPLLERLTTLAQLVERRFNRLTIKHQRSRWGSCSVLGNINLNVNLLFLPPILVRYVMVHELCHLKEFNHSAQFWAWVERYQPQSRALHQQIKLAQRFVPAWLQTV